MILPCLGSLGILAHDMELPSLLEMLKAGVHYGHRTTKWHPKMEPYIFGARNNVHIINLEKTQEMLGQALEFIKELVGNGGVILLVGTKPAIQEITKQQAILCGMPYVHLRWLGGTLTNFSVLRGRIKYFLDLRTKKESGELQKYTKKEQVKFAKEIDDLEEKFSGLASLERRPEALFLVDIGYESTAVREAQRTKVKTVAICDTNVNPTDIDYCIPANDDAIKSVELMTKLVAAAVLEGKELAARKKVEAQTKAVEETVK